MMKNSKKNFNPVALKQEASPLQGYSELIEQKYSSPDVLVMTYAELSEYLGHLCSNHSLSDRISIKHSDFDDGIYYGTMHTVSYYQKFRYKYIFQRIYVVEGKHTTMQSILDEVVPYDD